MKILEIIKRFFRWPYSVYSILVGYGLLIEWLIKGQWFDGIVITSLGIWAFLIEYNRK
jgi:hypothetical protein